MIAAVNTYLLASPFTTSAATHWIPKIAAMGSQGIEIVVEDPSLIDAGVIADLLKQYSLPCVAICGAFGPGRDLRGTTDEQRGAQEYIKTLISLAAKWGAPVVCGPLYSRVGRAGMETPKDRGTQWQTVVASLKTLGAFAEASGVKLAIEPLNRFETDFINTTADVLRLVEEVGSPAVGIHLDTFHMNIEEKSAAAAIRLAGQHLFHVHACGCDRGIPGRDHIDWDAIFAALKSVKYNRALVVESFTPDVEVIARAAAIWRTLDASPEETARAGIAFLKSHL